MKQVLLLLLLFVSAKDFACPYSITQNNWRWRNNDGDETSATWKAAQTTPATYNTNQGVVRLRVEITSNYRTQNQLTGQCVNRTYPLVDSLQYTTNVNDASSWKSIGNNPSRAFVMAGTDAFMTQSTPTTSQITGSNNTFSAGKAMVSDTTTTTITITTIGRTEVEWAIVGTSNMLPDTTYYFRQYYRFSRVYSSYAALNTTAPPLPVKITRFTIIGEGGKARLEWATASEQNNDRFEVQRSPNQRIWQTIATVKGKGNSASPVSYSTSDDNPLNGVNYYRLQQFDKDGKSTFSETRFLKMTGGGAVVSVWPNPVREVINFSLGNVGAAKLEAMLSDASGKTIYRQAFTSIAPNAVNKLILPQKPAPGVYLLQLKGDGLLESMKVVVQ